MTSLRTRSVLAVLLCLIALYVVFLPADSALYQLILFPIPDRRAPSIQAALDLLSANGIKSEFVSFRSSNGALLSGLYLRNPSTQRVFLYSHTKGNNMFGKLHVAENLLLCGGSVLAYDYQGYGKSQGRISVDGSIDDAIAAYDYLHQQKHFDSKNIIAYGESYGTGATSQLMQRRALGGVILHSAFASLRDAGRDSFPFLWLYPDWMFPRQIMNNVSAFEGAHPPLLLIHGDQDTTTRLKNSETIFAAASEPKELFVVSRSGHCSFGKQNEVVQVIKKFMARNDL